MFFSSLIFQVFYLIALTSGIYLMYLLFKLLNWLIRYFRAKTILLEIELDKFDE